MKFSGAIFDLDGTLIDSMFIWETLGEDYLLKEGITPAPDTGRTLKKMTIPQAAVYFREKYGLGKSAEEIMSGMLGMVEDFYFYSAPLKKGAAEFLHCLCRKGVRMLVLTATDAYLAERALVRLGADGYFSDIISCGALGMAKDSPAIYMNACGILGTHPSATVVFEDVFHALTAAKRGGFFTVGVFDAAERNAFGMKRNADMYVRDFCAEELRELF